MDIILEPDKSLTIAQELGLVQAAFARGPSPMLRERLARLCLMDDRFDSVIDLLDSAQDTAFSEEMMLFQALLAREATQANEHLILRSERTWLIAQNDEQRAAVLADRGKALHRLGQSDAARDILEQALALDPANKDACKRMAALELAAGRASCLIERLEQLLQSGVGHARVFAAKALAQAQLGHDDAARATVGLSETCVEGDLPVPSGWRTDDFQAALAREVLRHPGLRYERYGSASNLTWRVENPARADKPAIRALIAGIAAELHRRIAALPAAHPWTQHAPRRGGLRVWSVITDGDGFEDWHVHQFGWLSGVYYVQVPDGIARGTGREGCLAFGLPETLAGAVGSDRFGMTMVRPRPGQMVTFPSHAYHRTFAHQGRGKRICVAYDLRPA